MNAMIGYVQLDIVTEARSELADAVNRRVYKVCSINVCDVFERQQKYYK